MALSIFGAQAAVSLANRALFNTSPSNSVYLNQVANAGTTDASEYAFANKLGASLGNESAADLTALIFANLGVNNTTVNAESLAILEAAVTDYISFHGTQNIGIIALQLGQILSTKENDGTFGVAAKAWNQEVLTAYNYSTNPANNASQVGEGANSTTFSLTTGWDSLTGTAASDVFVARVVQNANGEQTNQLATGDQINGGAGNDTLQAKVISASALNAGPAMGITPETVDVENVEITALTTSNVRGADEIVDLNAQFMLGLDSVASVQSNASLVISNLTTLTDSGVYAERRNTEDVTIRMDHTGNGDAVTKESDLEVYFDQDYLVSGQTSNSSAFFFLLDEKAELARLNGDLTVPRLREINVDGLRFTVTINGVTSEIITLNDRAAWLADQMDTHETFIASLQDELAALIAAGTLPEGTTLTLNPAMADATFLDDGSQSGDIPAIVLNVPDASVVTPVGFAQVEDALGNYDVYGDFNNIAESNVLPVTSTIELEKVGRGSDGGDLTVGGMSTNGQNVWNSGSGSKGIEQFNITVSGDETQFSKLASLQSTNNTLAIVNVASAAGSAADLTIGNSHTSGVVVNAAGFSDDDKTTFKNGALKDVRVFNAASFQNDLELHAHISDESVAKYMDLTDDAASPAADNADFAYTFAGGNDLLNLNISKTNLAQSGTTNREDFHFEANMGAGNDKVQVQIGDGVGTLADAWFINSDLNKNLAINTGEGDDTVETFGAGTWTVNLGAGNDVIYSDNSGNQLNAAVNPVTLEGNGGDGVNYNSGRAAWVLNTADQATAGAAVVARDIDNLVSDANDTFTLWRSTVSVTFLGHTAEVQIQDFTTSDLSLNNLIKNAIAQDNVLSKLIVAEDGPANTLVIRSLIDGEYTAADFEVDITAPALTTISPTQLAAFNAATGASATSFSDVQTLIDAGVTAWATAADYVSALANDATDELTGVASSAVTNSTITGGAGDDVIVLSTGATSAETVVYAPGFGNDAIVNFTAVGATGVDTLDFTALRGIGDALTFNVLTANNSISIALQGTTNDTAAEVAALYTDSATAQNHVYVAYDGTVGTVYTVTDTVGVAAGSVTATLVGTIELVNGDWTDLTAANFA
ncbi:hypothetical protein [Acidovorax sp. CCYZU-2555]|uniref:beta strand repeat-containing protein n=1 Tax=Acidovorax sp. CCYZU-2555 TaxID=2835042 RepID=UPI001BCAB7A5|nr:hypothetical protein [Acidovorax sp. CCYZU-2555]MBS7777093.1 hypothetical protein [Acidovorax sp. CCYZU-2555]